MSKLTLTDYATLAIANGINLDVTTIVFGSGTGYIPTTNMTDVHGIRLFSTDISSRDHTTAEVTDFICVFPEFAVLSTVSVGELALFTDDGHLFAIGCLPYPVVKSQDTRLVFHAICQTANLTDYVQVPTTWNTNVPRILNYSDLVNPQLAGDTVLVE